MQIGDQVFHIVSPWMLWVVTDVKDKTIRVTKGGGVLETSWFEIDDPEWRVWSQVETRTYPGAAERRHLVNK